MKKLAIVLMLMASLQMEANVHGNPSSGTYRVDQWGAKLDPKPAPAWDLGDKPVGPNRPRIVDR